MEEIEEWVDIKGYEGLYQVSSYGRVKSLERTIDNKLYGDQNIKERILKNQFCSTTKYYKIKLSKNNIKKTWSIHQLVAINFLNHKPLGFLLVVNHIDNNRLNNKIHNLEIIPARENTSKDIDKTKTSSKYVGVNLCKKSLKWIAKIRINGKKTYLGLFNNEIDAHLAYQKALQNLKQ